MAYAQTSNVLSNSSIRSLDEAIKNETYLTNRYSTKIKQYEELRNHLSVFKRGEAYEENLLFDCREILGLSMLSHLNTYDLIYEWGWKMLGEDGTIMSELNNILRVAYNFPGREVLENSMDPAENISRFLRVSKRYWEKCSNYSPVNVYNNIKTCNIFVKSPETLVLNNKCWITSRLYNKLVSLDYRIEDDELDLDDIEIDIVDLSMQLKNSDLNYDLKVVYSKDYDPEEIDYLEDVGGLHDHMGRPAYKLIMKNNNDNCAEKSVYIENWNQKAIISLLEFLKDMCSRDEGDKQYGLIHKINFDGLKNLLFCHSLTLEEMFDKASQGKILHKVQLAHLTDVPIIFGSSTNRVTIDLDESEESLFLVEYMRGLNKDAALFIKMVLVVLFHYGVHNKEAVSFCSYYIENPTPKREGNLKEMKNSAYKKMLSEMGQLGYKLFGIKKFRYEKKKMSEKMSQVDLEMLRNIDLKIVDKEEDRSRIKQKEVKSESMEGSNNPDSSRGNKEVVLDLIITRKYPEILEEIGGPHYNVHGGSVYPIMRDSASQVEQSRNRLAYRIENHLRKGGKENAAYHRDVKSLKGMEESLKKQEENLPELFKNYQIVMKLDSIANKFMEDYPKLRGRILYNINDENDIKKIDKIIFKKEGEVEEKGDEKSNLKEQNSSKEKGAIMTLFEKIKNKSGELKMEMKDVIKNIRSDQIISEIIEKNHSRLKNKNRNRRRGKKDKWNKGEFRNPEENKNKKLQHSLGKRSLNILLNCRLKMGIYFGTKNIVKNSVCNFLTKELSKISFKNQKPKKKNDSPKIKLRCNSLAEFLTKMNLAATLRIKQTKKDLEYKDKEGKEFFNENINLTEKGFMSEEKSKVYNLLKFEEQ